jgi:uncharacterized repeat protein (TIGR03803 family)
MCGTLRVRNCFFTTIAIVVLALGSCLSDAYGQTLTTVWSFTGANDGGSPMGGLVQVADGSFYGTTTYYDPTGVGTVFRMSPSGIVTGLWLYAGAYGGGFYPQYGLIKGNDGNLYGTTSDGGINGAGSIYRMSTNGVPITLWSFTGGSDGEGPIPALTQGQDGNFYGVAQRGGTYGWGTIFRLSPDGELTNLWSFTGGNDGLEGRQGFAAGLVQGNDGNFYGTTTAGGPEAYGTVFRITPAGDLTNLWAFDDGPNGGAPEATLALGVDGNFYGTATHGGTYNYGTIFRISPCGEFTNLWTFTGGVDGGEPSGALLQGSDGNFYGVTHTTFPGDNGPQGGNGTIFRISPNGNLTTLWTFTGGTDGRWPYANLIQGCDGNFYGTTSAGGSGGEGVIFKITVPLTPPPNQISRLIQSNSNVIVQIPAVAGATYQLQYMNSFSSSGNWSNICGASVTNSIGGMLTVTNSSIAGAPQGFYRFNITP